MYSIVSCNLRDRKTVFGALFVSWIQFEAILKNKITTSTYKNVFKFLFLKLALFLGLNSNKCKHKDNRYKI